MKFSTHNNCVDNFKLKSLSKLAEGLIPEATELIAFKNTDTYKQHGKGATEICVVSIEAVFYGDTFYIYNTSLSNFSEALELCSVEIKKIKDKFAQIKGKDRKGENIDSLLTSFLIDQFSFRKLHMNKHSVLLESNTIDKILGIVKKSNDPREALAKIHSLSIYNSK